MLPWGALIIRDALRTGPNKRIQQKLLRLSIPHEIIPLVLDGISQRGHVAIKQLYGNLFLALSICCVYIYI